ncbi:hypothetical protein L873DRAFT_1792057 [Choiromyces venosus 120613-1]|uniref:Yeast cell wall synthesis Kre9/Knh1-like N-terminal domain-containing protein n=1 Tax=Choiromyces venosus 120613-1 TaxID=1336337 RepID=A0A3N4JC82_9PEZI|nr:hypothetical protein L873DRAFT_1792057 [Choiromyces venosus 120613-1]
MKYSLFTAVAAAFTSFANAYTTPVGDNPEGNPIVKPGLGEIVPVGAPYTITWTPTTTGTVTLVLLRGPSINVLPLYPIVEKIPNTGTYSWTPATNLEADTSRYGIQLIDDTTGKYQYTTQFGISNPNMVSSSSSSSAPIAPTSSMPSSMPTSSMPTSSSPVPTTSKAATTSGFVTSGTVIYSTSMVTVTSCGAAVTACPGRPQNTTAPHPPPATTWISPVWNATVSKPAVPTGSTPAAPSTNVTKSSPSAPVIPISPGAGDKIRVGGAMFVVMVAGFALLL